MGLLRELARSLRGDLRKPFLTLACLITLALGIGTSATFVSIGQAVLLRPLPFPRSDRLVMVWEQRRESSSSALLSAYPTFEEWQAATHAFESLAVDRLWQPVLPSRMGNFRLQGAAVSERFFSVLGAGPALGRLLIPADFRPGAPPVVVLSHRLWRERFGSDPGLVGGTISLDGTPTTVVGVMRAGLPLGEPLMFQEADVVRPLVASPQIAGRGNRFLRVVARLRPGVTREQAAAEARAVSARLMREHPSTNSGWSADVGSLRELTVGGTRATLGMLVGAAILLFLVACINVTNLLLLRASVRRREFAVRLAVGASRRQLLTQLLAEGLPLVILGSLLGLLLAWWGWSTFTALLPATVVRLMGVGWGIEVLAAMVALAALAVVAVHVAPFLEISRVPTAEVLNESPSGAGENRGRLYRGSTVIAAEIALSLVLLVGAGLLVRSLLRLTRVDLGFRADRVLVASLDLPFSKYQDARQAQVLFEGLQKELEGRSSIQKIALINSLPLRKSSMSTGVALPVHGKLPWQIDLRGVSPRYFQSMTIPLYEGRDFSSADGAEGRDVVILNRVAAARLWPGQSAVGRRVVLDWGSSEPREVVGVVGDVHHEAVDKPPRPEAYLPFQEVPFWSLNLVVRTAADPRAEIPAVRRQLQAADPDVTVVEISPLEQVVADTLARPRIYTRILSVFAAIGLLLVAGGVYAVTAFFLSTRRREIGIRIALGAGRRDLLRSLLRQGMGPILVGVPLGLGGAYILSRGLASLLFEIAPLDPLTFAGVPLALTAVALLAIYLPARDAVHIDPVRMIKEG